MRKLFILYTSAYIQLHSMVTGEIILIKEGVNPFNHNYQKFIYCPLNVLYKEEISALGELITKSDNTWCL